VTGREFVAFTDVNDDAQIEQFVEIAMQTWADQGTVLARFRAWPGRVFIGVTAILVVASALFTAVAPDSSQLMGRAALLFSVLFWAGLFVALGAIERHRVCEHGLIVGFRTRSQYVIPWSTVDPGRVRIARRPVLLGRHPDVPSMSPHFRLGWLSTEALFVNGLDTAMHSWMANPDLFGVTDPVKLGGRARSTPFVWWVLGTQRPRRLAEAIEAAMVADGYDAHGLAERAMRQSTTLTWRPAPRNPIPPRYPLDPVLGVNGPLLP